MFVIRMRSRPLQSSRGEVVGMCNGPKWGKMVAPVVIVCDRRGGSAGGRWKEVMADSSSNCRNWTRWQRVATIHYAIVAYNSVVSAIKSKFYV